VHRDYLPNRQFRDVQVKGPFAPDGRQTCILEDQVEYTLPLARMTGPLAGAFVRCELERLS